MKTVAQIIDDAVCEFHNRINELCEVGPHQKLKCKYSALGALKLADNSFYENAYYETALENCVREHLITSVLIRLLVARNVRCFKLKKKALYTFRSTESYKDMDVVPLAFIFGESPTIGIRYTGLDQDQAETLANKYNLAKIIRINWSSIALSHRDNSPLYEEMTPEMFFDRYLSLDDYAIYLNKIMAAIEKANAVIGIETIHRMSHRYLSDLRVEICNDLRIRQFDKMRFKVMPRPDGTIPAYLASLGQLAFTNTDYQVLEHNFKNNSLYNALLGSEGFAKCFMTAEYLYRAIKSGQHFDYTAVACGYLKAVEQLIYKLLKINLKYPSPDTLWIMKNNKNIPKKKYIEGVTVRQNPNPDFSGLQVVFQADFERNFNTTLVPMINFLHDNKHGWNLSPQGQDTIYQLLLNYAKDYRNDHFHKDNIDSQWVVECVRNNTLLIIYVLIGGYKLTGTTENDVAELGILDDSFDRFYRSVKQGIVRSQYSFILYYPGQPPKKAFRHHVQELSTYDEHGLLTPSRIRFVETSDFSSHAYEQAMEGMFADKEFYVTAQNMPEKISFVNRNEEIFISW